jgi:uncharacterized protein (TIGR02265 family)
MKPVGEAWGSAPITLEQAERFAGLVEASAAERAALTKMYLNFPPHIQTRGVFFAGVGRVVAKRAGPAAWPEALARVGAPARFFPFNYYPHRDMYKVHAVVSNVLAPEGPLERGMYAMGRLLYPIFRDSLLGRTMSAFAGDEPKTLLRLLCEAYRLSVDDNEHHVAFDEGPEAVWRCRVEPAPWYPAIFRGIVEGTAASHGVRHVDVSTLDQKEERTFFRFAFRIRW